VKIAQRLAWLAAIATLLGSLIYVFRYMAVWEFHRSMFAALLFIGAEVAVASALVIRAVRRSRPEPDPQVLARVRESAPRRDHFAWLRPDPDQLNVFVTVLIGGGLVVSGLAWLLERVARGTATGQLEEGLASRLSEVGFPPGGLVPDEEELRAAQGPYGDDERVRLLLGPGGR
jgi:hypothetical protein